jgi:hypothetical protein
MIAFRKTVKQSMPPAVTMRAVSLVIKQSEQIRKTPALCGRSSKDSTSVLRKHEHKTDCLDTQLISRAKICIALALMSTSVTRRTTQSAFNAQGTGHRKRWNRNEPLQTHVISHTSLQTHVISRRVGEFTSTSYADWTASSTVLQRRR